jgi:ureidoacrylate peracid hydrolase
MMKVAYNKQLTALLVIDPYNDFISDGGKLWDRLKGVAEANNCVPNMLQVLNAARKAELRVFYALHHRYRPGDYETWKYIAPVQKAAWLRKSFEYGTWGGEIRRESSLNRAKSLPRSIGVPVVSPTTSRGGAQEFRQSARFEPPTLRA